jgi:hypothetical protein
MAIREGRWRCPYCSGVNRGADLACKGCGATRDKDVRFFLEDEAPEVTDERLLAQARAGADWLCLFCQTSNPPANAACANCGAEKGKAPSRETREIPLRASPAPAAAPRTAPRRLGLLAALGLLLVLGFCGFGILRALRTTEQPVTVAGFEWERSIEIEAYRTVREEAWEGELPSGARPVSTSRQVHHTERERTGTRRVKTGTRDLGNGFFEDVYAEEPVYSERPVYRTRVRFDIERWVHERTERASGHDQSPAWPSAAKRSQEREGARAESYFVLLRGRERSFRYRLGDPARWSALREGEELTAVIRGGSSVVEIR